MWTDSHCHLEDSADVDAARAAGVSRMITVGTDVDHSRRGIAFARQHDGVFATVGLHPHDAKQGLDGLTELLDDPMVVAVGECGLDYYYDHSPRDVQRAVFDAQVGLALERDLTLVIHTRDAWDDTFAVLDSVGVPSRTVFHCFTGGPAEAEQAIERGAALSFSGIVTFKNADDVRGAVAICPSDRLLVETDSPYLTPEPHRGRRNEPALVPLVGEAIGRVRGIDVSEVEALTWENASKWFELRSSTNPT